MIPPVQMGPLLTAKEVAGILRCSTVHVYGLAKRGELPSVRYGSRVVFHPDDLKEFIGKHRAGKEPRE
jgi:excisionase family DNA binding protein